MPKATAGRLQGPGAGQVLRHAPCALSVVLPAVWRREQSPVFVTGWCSLPRKMAHTLCAAHPAPDPSMPLHSPERHLPAQASRLALRGAVPGRAWLVAWLLVCSIALAPLLGQMHRVVHAGGLAAATLHVPVEV